ncbi:hypothetical protein [Streptosporangium sp. NPDC003464]
MVELDRGEGQARHGCRGYGLDGGEDLDGHGLLSGLDGGVGVHDRDLPHQLSGLLVAGLDEPAVGGGVEVLDRLDLADDLAAVREDHVEADEDGSL